jgi:hypothetical protein
MAEPNDDAAQTNDRRKKVAAGLLLVVFVTVLYSQFGGAGEDPEVPTRPKRPSPVAAATAKPQTRRWPQASLSETLKNDPFAQLRQAEKTPEEAEPDPELAQRQSEEASKASAASLENQRVRAIVSTKQGPVALFGTKLIKVGDMIDGARVVEIRPDGIIVEPQ